MDAREWLRSVSDSARLILADSKLEELRRSQALSISAPFTTEVISRTPNPDRMRAVDKLIDAQATRRERLAGAYEDIAQARSAFEGMRSVGWMEHEAADVLEAVHVLLMSKQQIALALNLSYATTRRRYDYGVDWLDAHGIAHAREGYGLAT